MRALFSVPLLAFCAVGVAKNTEPASAAELSKVHIYLMSHSMARYDQSVLTERAHFYVYNASNQNLLKPKFQGTLTVSDSKFNGAQTAITMSSALPGSFADVIPPGIITNILVHFKFPIESYYYSRKLSLKLLSAEKMRVDAPLTDADSLRQFLLRSTGPQITQAFKKNPNLTKVRDKANMPPMAMAILTGAAGNVQALEAAGLKVSGPYPYKLTALHLACGSTAEMINYVKRKVPAWSSDAQGYNPLFHSVFSLQAGNVRALKPTKAQVAMRGGPSGNTPLHDAAAIGEISVVKALMDFGADPNALNSAGVPPIVFAFVKDNKTIEQTISVIKPNLSIKIGKEKYNLLQYAVICDQSGPAALLIRHGFKPRDKNAEGKDCFDLLSKIDHPVDRAQMRRVLEGKRVE